MSDQYRDELLPAPEQPRLPAGVDKPGAEAESPTLPLPPPRDRADLDVLLRAIAAVSHDERHLIIETIDGFASDERASAAAVLLEALFDLPTSDASRTGLILSVLGQLAEPSSIDALERFVWLTDEELFAPHGDTGGERPRGDTADSSYFASGMLQSRAAEMLVWVGREDAWERAARILAEHPSVAVRLAVVDALAFAGDDDPTVLDRIRQLTSDEDRWAVGMPRRHAGVDAGEFLRHLERFQAEVGDEVPTPLHTHRRHRTDEKGD